MTLIVEIKVDMNPSVLQSHPLRGADEEGFFCFRGGKWMKTNVAFMEIKNGFFVCFLSR